MGSTIMENEIEKTMENEMRNGAEYWESCLIIIGP